jgi:hypothetical protein
MFSYFTWWRLNSDQGHLGQREPDRVHEITSVSIEVGKPLELLELSYSGKSAVIEDMVSLPGLRPIRWVLGRDSAVSLGFWDKTSRHEVETFVTIKKWTPCCCFRSKIYWTGNKKSS